MPDKKDYKDKPFELVQQEEVIYDQQLETEQVGYAKDAWRRFKRNRVSLVAFIILLFLIIMAIIGPWFNTYGFEDNDVRMDHLPPRIPAIEWMGIYDGTKEITRSESALTHPMLPEGTIKEWVNEHETRLCSGNIIRDPDGIRENDRCIRGGQEVSFDYTYNYTVVVDYYLWRNHRNSWGDNAIRTFTNDRYQQVMNDNPDAIIEVVDTFGDTLYRFEVIGEDGSEHTISLSTLQYNTLVNLFSGQIVPDEAFTDDVREFFALNVDLPIDVVEDAMFHLEFYMGQFLEGGQISNGEDVLDEALYDLRERDDLMYRVRVDHFQLVGYTDRAPSYWFGTDNNGRDLFTLIWLGARTSLIISFTVAILNIFIGIVLGALGGYYGGKFDLYTQRLFEIIGGIPFLPALTLLVMRFGSAPWVVVLAFTLTGWIGPSRTVRAQFYRYKNREYVLAARSLGAGDGRIMSRHIFPNAVGTIVTATILMIPMVIFTEATFSFLGIINYGSMTSIGRLANIGQTYMHQSFHLLLYPSIFISLLMLSFNMFGNGLRDALNPSLRGVEE